MPEPIPNNDIQAEMERIERKRKLHAFLLALGFGLIVLLALFFLFFNRLFGPGPGELVVPGDKDGEVVEEPVDPNSPDFLDSIINSVFESAAFQAAYGLVDTNNINIVDLGNQLEYTEGQITSLVTQINDGQIQVNSMFEQITILEAQLDNASDPNEIASLENQISIYYDSIASIQAQINDWQQQVIHFANLAHQIGYWIEWCQQHFPPDFQFDLSQSGALELLVQDLIVSGDLQFDNATGEWQFEGDEGELQSEDGELQIDPACLDPDFAASNTDCLQFYYGLIHYQITDIYQQIQYITAQVEFYFHQFYLVYKQFSAFYDGIGGFGIQVDPYYDIRNVVVSVDLEQSTYQPGPDNGPGTAVVVGTIDMRAYSFGHVVKVRVRHQVPGGEIFVSEDVSVTGPGGANLQDQIFNLQNADADREFAISELRRLQSMYASHPTYDFSIEIADLEDQIVSLETQNENSLFFDEEFQSILRELEDDLYEQFVYPFSIEITDVPFGSYFEVIEAPGNINDFSPTDPSLDRYVWDQDPDEAGFQEGGFTPYFDPSEAGAAEAAYESCTTEASAYYAASGSSFAGTPDCRLQSVLDQQAVVASGAPVYYAYDNDPSTPAIEQSEIYTAENDCLQAAENYYDAQYGTNNTFVASCFPAEFDDLYYGQETAEESATTAQEDVVNQILSAPPLFGPVPFSILPRVAYRWFFYGSFSPLQKYSYDPNNDGTAEVIYFNTQIECQTGAYQILAGQDPNIPGDPDFITNPRVVNCYREVFTPATAVGVRVDLLPYLYSPTDGSVQIAGKIFNDTGEAVSLRIQYGPGPRLLNEDGQTSTEVALYQIGIQSSEELLREITQKIFVDQSSGQQAITNADGSKNWEHVFPNSQLDAGSLYYYRVIDANTGEAYTTIHTFRLPVLAASSGDGSGGGFNFDDVINVDLGDGVVVPVLAANNGLVPCGHDGNNSLGYKNGYLDDYEVCTFDHFVIGVANVIDWLFRFGMTPLIMILLIYSGARFVLARGNPEALQEAKRLLRNVLIGAGISLSAWLIVATILNFLGVQRQAWYFDLDPNTTGMQASQVFISEPVCLDAAEAYYSSQGYTQSVSCDFQRTSYVLLDI